MALRIRAQFKSERDQIWTIQIHDTDWTGSVTTMDVAPPGFTLSWAGGEDIFHPVIPSTCTVPVYVNSATDDTFIEDLATADEGRFRLVVRKGDGDAASLWWVGLLTVDNITLSDEPHPQLFELQAVDGLQLLSRVEYDNSDQNASVAGVMLYCLNQIGTSDLFSTSGIALPFLRVFADVEPDENTYDDPFDEVNLVPGYWNPFTEAYDFDITSEQVLTQLAMCYNSRLMLCEGSFHFLPVARFTGIVSSTLNLRPYRSDGTKPANQVKTFQFTVNAASSEFIRLRGWERRVVAPVSAVQRPLIYGEGHLIDNTSVGGVALYPSGSTQGSSVATYSLSSDNTFPAGTTFTINGLCDIHADYIGTSTGTFQCARLKLSIMLRVGSYYIRRTIELHDDEYTQVNADEFNNATSDESVLVWQEPGELQWTTGSSSRLQYGSDVLNFDAVEPNFATGADDSTQIPLDITTPGLPVAQDVDIELTITPVLFNSNGSGANQAKLDACTTFTDIVLKGGENLNGSTVIYKASNSNNATEVRQLEPVNFGSELVVSNQYYYNPSEFYNVNGGLPEWTSYLQSSAKELHELCVLDQAKYFDQPREIHTGSLYSNDGTVLPFYAFVYDGDRLKNFMLVSMTMHADAETYELEMHELNETGAPTSEIIKPKPAKPVPTVQAFDSLNKRVSRETRSASNQFIQVTGDIADIQTDVSAITRAQSSSGGESSLNLADLGDVKISGPQAGHILEYNVSAQRFVNVAHSGGTGSASEAFFAIDSTGGTDNVTSTPSTLTLDSTQFISSASKFTLSSNVLTINMDMRAVIAFYVGFDDPNGADRTKGEAFLEKSTDGGTTWALVIGSNAFAYLRNGNNNDTDTATSGNLILSVSNGDQFRVRVKTQGSALTTSTVANMSGLSVFDLLGGAAGADGSDGSDGTDGANGDGFTGGTYNAATGVVTFTSDDGLGFSTADLRGANGADGSDGANGTDGVNGTDGADGDGFTGGSYNAATGVVTFTSDDGLGFSTGDLRGADGADGADGTNGTDGADGADGSDALALGGNDQTLTADRSIDVDGNTLTIEDGTTDIMKVSNADGVQVFGEFKVDSGAVTGASIKLEEADLLGQNFIELKAPISITADTTLTLPDGDGSANQSLVTNGSGTLSWATRISEINPVTKGVLTIKRVTVGNVPRLYIKGEDDLAGVFFKVPEAISTDVTFELPGTDGADGDVLQTDGSGSLSFNTPFSYITLQSSFYAADGNGDYIPIGGTLSETTSSNYYTIWTAPADGEVVKATCICQATTAGSSTLRIRKYPTPVWIDQDTQTVSSVYTTVTFDFTTATFSAGDRMQFFFDPTGRPNGVQITLLIKLNH